MHSSCVVGGMVLPRAIVFVGILMMERTLALYTRYFWKEKNIIWVYAKTPKLFKSMEEYRAHNGIPAPELELHRAAEREILVAATLASESQMERDAWGWTIRLPQQNWGVFCAVDPEGFASTKIRLLPPQAVDIVGMIAVQRQMPDLPVRQTNLIPFQESLHLCVEQFFEESEQLPARISIVGDEGVMALSMPDAEWNSVSELSEAELSALFHELLEAGKLEKTHESVYYYECRCCYEAMVRMLEALPEDQQSAIWGGENLVEIECPRCGKLYHIQQISEQSGQA